MNSPARNESAMMVNHVLTEPAVTDASTTNNPSMPWTWQQVSTTELDGSTPIRAVLPDATGPVLFASDRTIARAAKCVARGAADLVERARVIDRSNSPYQAVAVANKA